MPVGPKIYSSSDPVYECKENPCCKDLGLILLYRHAGDPENGVESTGETIGEMEYVRRFNQKEINFLEWDKTSVVCGCEIKKNKRKELIRVTRISKKFMKRTFETIEILDPENFKDPEDKKEVTKLSQSQRRALRVIGEYLDNYEENRMDGKGFALYGSGGVGKTHMLAAKTLWLIEKDVQSVFVNFSEILEEIRNCYETDGDEKTSRQVKPSEIINLMKSAEDLSLDDIGKERPSPWVLEVLYNIMNHRYEEELPTSFSTNLSDEELKSHVGQFIHRRLTEPCAGRMMIIEGPSYERIKRKST